MTHHLHTSFSDGKDSPLAMVEAALAKGWRSLGFSDHGPVPGETWCMPAERLEDYHAELAALRARFAGRIELCVGLELDWFETGGPTALAALAGDPRLDYWIGSFHFFEHAGKRWAIDGNLSMVEASLAEACGGSRRRFVERYWEGVIALIESCRPPVVGHLDLLRKQNPQLGFYDPADPWYRTLWMRALDAAGRAGSIIEVNSGGMARGYSDEPYPSWEILAEIRRRDLPIQLNSDSHQASTLDFAYDGLRRGLAELGFRTQRVFSAGRWTDQAW